MDLGIKTGLLGRHKAVLFALLGIGMIGLILIMPEFSRLVRFLGHRIAQKDIWADYIKGVVWAVFLTFVISFWPLRSQDKKALLLIWLVKCFVMLGPMLFYEYHYQTDAFGFFSQVSASDYSLWKAMTVAGWHNLPHTFILFMHKYSLFDSFHATKVSFGMVGLVAVYIFYRSAIIFLRQEKVKLLYLFGFFPSLLFWSSTLGKEPILLLYIAAYSYGMIKWIRFGSLSSAVIILCSITLTAIMRPWMGDILGLPAFIITILAINTRNLKRKIAFLLMTALVILYSNGLVMSSLGVKSDRDLLRMMNIKFIVFSVGGSATDNNKAVAVVKPQRAPLASSSAASATDNNKAVVGPQQAPSASSGASVKREKNPILPDYITSMYKVKYNSFVEVILNIPQGVFTALFRPLPGEVDNLFGFLAGLEDAFLLIFFVIAVKRMQWRRLKEPVCLWAILLVMIWAVVYEFVGFNLGTICRYRSQIIPILIGLLMYLAFGRGKLSKLRE